MTEPRTTSRGPVALFAAIGLAVVVSVLLAPLLHHAIARFGREPEFPKVFRYLLLGLLVLALAWTLRPWRDLPRDAWGLATRPGRNLRLAVAGIATIAALLVAVALLHGASGLVEWDTGDGAQKARQRAWRFGLFAIPFALLEETFFRGWLVDRFARRRSALVAALLGALAFAVLHAFRRSSAGDVVPGVDGALAVLASWGRQLADVADFGPSFVGLFVFAMALSAARARLRTLAFGVGMHAAAYAFLSVYSALTDPTTDGRSWLGSKWLYDGVPGIALLGGLAVALWPRSGADVHESRHRATFRDVDPR